MTGLRALMFILYGKLSFRWHDAEGHEHYDHNTNRRRVAPENGPRTAARRPWRRREENLWRKSRLGVIPLANHWAGNHMEACDSYRPPARASCQQFRVLHDRNDENPDDHLGWVSHCLPRFTWLDCKPYFIWQQPGLLIIFTDNNRNISLYATNLLI